MLLVCSALVDPWGGQLSTPLPACAHHQHQDHSAMLCNTRLACLALARCTSALHAALYSCARVLWCLISHTFCVIPFALPTQ